MLLRQGGQAAELRLVLLLEDGQRRLRRLRQQ